MNTFWSCRRADWPERIASLRAPPVRAAAAGLRVTFCGVGLAIREPAVCRSDRRDAAVWLRSSLEAAVLLFLFMKTLRAVLPVRVTLAGPGFLGGDAVVPDVRGTLLACDGAMFVCAGRTGFERAVLTLGVVRVGAATERVLRTGVRVTARGATVVLSVLRGVARRVTLCGVAARAVVRGAAG